MNDLIAGANDTIAESLGLLREQPQRLAATHMPVDFAISLSQFRRGGTDAFLSGQPSHIRRQAMAGFDSDYVNIIDYIVRITHRIWEQRDVGYIYDTYSHDATVWDDHGLQFGRDKIVADTLHTTNAFPDIRLVADEVIWAGDADAGFHTSHRTVIHRHQHRLEPLRRPHRSARPRECASQTASPAPTRSSTSTFCTIPPVCCGSSAWTRPPSHAR